MQKFPRRWDKITCINFLQRKIILNSIAYYELNTSRLTDKQYDELSRQLVDMQKDVNIQDTQYGYVFYDFDGTTGFDLYHRLNENDKKYMMRLCSWLFVKTLKNNKKKRKGNLF